MAAINKRESAAGLLDNVDNQGAERPTKWFLH